MASSLSNVLDSFLSSEAVDLDEPEPPPPTRRPPAPTFEDDEDLATPLSMNSTGSTSGVTRVSRSTSSTVQALLAGGGSVQTDTRRVLRVAPQTVKLLGTSIEGTITSCVLRTLVASISASDLDGFIAASSVVNRTGNTLGELSVCAVVSLGEAATKASVSVGDYLLVRRAALATNTDTPSQPGCLATHVLVPDLPSSLAEGTVVPLPAWAQPEEALIAADELSSALHAAASVGGATPLSSSVKPCYAVLGCGPIGCLSVVALRHLYGPDVAIVCADDVEARRALALGYGATEALPFHKREGEEGYPDFFTLSSRVRGKLTGCCGVIVAESGVSPSGHAVSFEMLVAAARLVEDGGKICITGALINETKEDNKTNTLPTLEPIECFQRNLTLSFGRGDHDTSLLKTAFEVLRAKPNPKALNASVVKIITHRLPLEAAQRAFELMSARATSAEAEGCVKAVMSVDPTANKVVERGGSFGGGLD